MNQLIASLDKQYALLHSRSRDLIQRIPTALLYEHPLGSTNGSCGEYVLRSAAAVEQTFGGITANLWDDPADWTLPETLSTPEKILEYLEEVEATRRRGFELLRTDDDLSKEIMASSGKTLLVSLLLETLARATHQQGAAWAMFEMLRNGSDLRSQNSDLRSQI
jgi:hypothetical protein